MLSVTNDPKFSTIKREYRHRLKERMAVGKTSRGLISELAKEYDRKRVTISTWKNRDPDNWDNIEPSIPEINVSQKKKESVATETKKTVATQKTNVATKPKKKSNHSKYDWDNLRNKFIKGKYPSLKAFADNEGIDPDYLYHIAGEQNWLDQKSEYTQEVLRESIKIDAEDLHQVRIENLRTAQLLQEKLNEAIPKLETLVLTGKKKVQKEKKRKNSDGLIQTEKIDIEEPTIVTFDGPINTKDLKNLADTLRTLQTTQFEAFGADLLEGDSSEKDKESINDFIEATRPAEDSVASLYEDEEDGD